MEKLQTLGKQPTTAQLAVALLTPQVQTLVGQQCALLQLHLAALGLATDLLDLQAQMSWREGPL